MFSNEAIKQGGILADGLLSDGVSLNVTDGSPFKVLLATMMTMDIQADIPAELKRSVSPQIDGFSPHDSDMDALAEFVAGRVAASNAYARDVVNPVVRDVVEQLLAYKSDLVADRKTNIKIIPWVLPAIYSAGLVENVLDTFKHKETGTRTFSPELNVKLGALTQSEFMTIVSSNNEEFTSALMEVVSEEDYGWSYRGNVMQHYGLTGSPDMNNNSSLYMFLVLRGLLKDRSDSIPVDLISTEDKLAITHHINNLAHNIIAKITNYSDSVKRGTVVVKYNAEARNVLVNATNYRKAIEAGATADTLIGALLADSTNFDHVSLARDIKVYDARYLRQEKMEVGKDNAMASGEIVRLISANLRNWIDQSELEEETKADRKVKLFEMLSKWSNVSEKDAVEFVRVVTAYTIAPNTDALSILSVMEEYMATAPEATMAEALLEANLERLARWVTSQLVQVKSDADEVVAVGFKKPYDRWS